MDLQHSFTVPAPIQVTWDAFNDIESVAECFPGATVTSVEGEEFKGSCKVKLGPISLVYNGTGKFVEKVESQHRFVVEAKGKDKRGNGTAGATVTAVFTSPTPESTEVSVTTDLAITGKPAQFGRGVMQDVSDKLLQSFVDCLQDKVGSSQAEEEPAPDVAASDGTAPDVAASDGAPSGVAPEGARKAAASAYSGVSAGAGLGDEPEGHSGGEPERRSAPPGADALDLGTTVLPILFRSYWKQGLGALLVLLVLRRLLGRR